MTFGVAIMRRRFLAACGLALAATAVGAHVIFGGQPFRRSKTAPPRPVDRTTDWHFFTPAEAAMVEAIVDRLIPADDLGIGGREAGCALFIDRQLAGDYGRSTVWYLAGPQRQGTPQQGPQFTDTVAQRYRAGLAALDRHCRLIAGKGFAALDTAAQDSVLGQLEGDNIRLAQVPAQALFAQLLKNTREGYFADPLYGGNRDMAGWRMIGFPGARYDYRDLIARRGQDLGLHPVSIYGGIPAAQEG